VLSTVEVAFMLNISERTLSQFVRAGDLKSHLVRGQRYFTFQDVRDFACSQGRTLRTKIYEISGWPK
jgi:excisionase family DNA binding protein